MTKIQQKENERNEATDERMKERKKQVRIKRLRHSIKFIQPRRELPSSLSSLSTQIKRDNNKFERVAWP